MQAAAVVFLLPVRYLPAPVPRRSFGEAVSGYTIQHISESQLVRAVEELRRVIRPLVNFSLHPH